MAPHRMMAKRRDAGFTLVEVMVAILLMAIGVIGMIGLVRVESRASASSRRETEAAVLAQDKLEELRTLAAPTATGQVIETNLDVNGYATGQYTRTSDITAAGTVYDIVVTVEWDDGTRVRRVRVHGQRGGT